MNMGTRLNAIEIADVSLEFPTNDGPVRALSRVSLNIAKGEFVSFIGPSGCGKTTLLRAVADLEAPTGGMIKVNGMSPAQARAARAYGYVFQAPALYPWRTVAGNIALPLEIMGVGKAERRKRVERGLELVNLKGFGPKFPWQLSGGMQQRASIARALSFDPDLLLMDEPFGALDEIVRDMLNQQLLELWARTSKTVLFVTHSIPEAVFLSTRIVVMSPRPGRIQEVIDCPFPRARTLDLRETAAGGAQLRCVSAERRLAGPPHPNPLPQGERGPRGRHEPGRAPVDGARGVVCRLVRRGGVDERVVATRRVRQRWRHQLFNRRSHKRLAQHGAAQTARAASDRGRALQADIRHRPHL
jgi:NitT/TauT family transport system ATP-binding protein